MSDASEVKRYFIVTVIGNSCVVYEKLVDGLDNYTEMVTASDHDRIVAELKAEIEELKKSADTIAAQARKLDLARVLYRAAIKIIDRYSKEKFPLNQTHTIEDVMDRYDKELEAIEQGEGM